MSKVVAFGQRPNLTEMRARIATHIVAAEGGRDTTIADVIRYEAAMRETLGAVLQQFGTCNYAAVGRSNVELSNEHHRARHAAPTIKSKIWFTACPRLMSAAGLAH